MVEKASMAKRTISEILSSVEEKLRLMRQYWTEIMSWKNLGVIFWLLWKARLAEMQKLWRSVQMVDILGSMIRIQMREGKLTPLDLERKETQSISVEEKKGFVPIKRATERSALKTKRN